MVVTCTTVVLFSYHSYPYLFETPVETYESKLLVIYFFNFCTVYIFYVTVQMSCLICLCPILKKPLNFFCSHQSQALLPQDKPTAYFAQLLLQVSLKNSGYALLQKAKLQGTNLIKRKTNLLLVLVLFLGVAGASSKLALSTSPLSSSSLSLSFTRFLIFFLKTQLPFSVVFPFPEGPTASKKDVHYLNK